MRSSLTMWRRSVAGLALLAMVGGGEERLLAETLDNSRNPEAVERGTEETKTASQATEAAPERPESASSPEEPVVIARDDFDGKASLEWDIRRPDPSHYSWSSHPGMLTITTQEGWSSFGFANYKNLFLWEVPETLRGDFDVTTRIVGFRPRSPWHQAGLICWNDDDNYLRCVHEWSDAGHRTFTFLPETRGNRTLEYQDAFEEEGDLWMRIARRGERYEFLASPDGKKYRSVTKGLWGDGVPKYLGLLARNGPAAQLGHDTPEIEAQFDYFEVRQLPGETQPGESAGTQDHLTSLTGDEKGFVDLFDGKDLSGWSVLGPGKFSVKDGMLRMTGGTGDMGFLWYDRKDFGDFTLVVDYRVSDPGDDSGIFLRLQRPQKPEDVETTGYEVQIYDKWSGQGAGTGAFIWLDVGYNVSEPVADAAKPAGEWNRFAIQVEGQKYSVSLNGRLVGEMTGDRGERGYIGLQSSPHESGIDFRKIRIREREHRVGKTREISEGPTDVSEGFTELSEGFTELFNGKDLTGWKMIGQGNASVQDGILQVGGGSGDGAYLCYSDRRFTDFTLVVDWMVSTRDGDSGVFLRIADSASDPGSPAGPEEIGARSYEVQIHDGDKAITPSGQVVDVWEGIPALDGRPSKPPGQWNRLEITVVGQHYTVALNGVKTHEFTGTRETAGFNGIQSHSRSSKVSFRQIAVKELSSPKAGHESDE